MNSAGQALRAGGQEAAPAAPGAGSGPAAHGLGVGGKGRTGWALARGTIPARWALLGTHTGPPGLMLCHHGPHRRLMVRNAGPADGAAGPARSAESPQGTPPLPPTRSSRPPRVPAPGPTRPRPPRSLANPLPRLLVCGLQGSRARRLSPRTTTRAWVHPRRSWLPASHAASVASSSPRPALSFQSRPTSSPSAGPLSADPCVRPLLSACPHPGSAAPRHKRCGGPHADRQVGLF